MRAILLYLNCLFTSFVFSQGLNFEKGLLPDGAISNQIVRTTGNSTICAFTSESGIYNRQILISKYDTNGNQNLMINASTSGYYNCAPIGLEINQDGSFYLLSYNMLFCYPISDFKWVLQKFDATGNQLWTREWDSPSWSYSQFQGLTIHQDETIGLNFLNLNNTSGILRLNNLGSTLDSINDQALITYENGYLTNGNIIAADAQSVFLYDNQGNLLNTYNIPSDIRELKVNNDSIFILTFDQIYLFGSGLNLISTSSTNGYNDFTRLKVNTQQVSCLAEDMNNIYVLSLPHNLSNYQAQTISCSHNISSPMDFEQNVHLSLSEAYNLYSDFALRLRDYALNSSNSVNISHADAGLTNLVVTDVQVIAGPNSEYLVKIWGDVVLKNFGTTTIQNCKILHAHGAPLNYSCGENYYDSLFTNLNLFPGESVTLNLGLIHDKVEYLPGQQTLNYNLCVYSAIPNDLVDLISNNDFICESVFLGYAALDNLSNFNIQIQPNPSIGTFEVKSDASLGMITIYDLTGKQIFKLETAEQNSFVDLSSFPSGAYHINIENQFGSYHKQLLLVDM
jgi:hypothetical protein